jgi:hypothetical protein
MASTNELAIVDDNNTVVAAMSGGNNQGYTFWSGAANPSDATFGVFLDGTLRATKAQIEGSFKVKAKNDERSIELCLNEDITRASNEDPVIRITNASGDIVTELNGNEYTSTSDMFDSNSGSLSIVSSSGTVSNSVSSDSSTQAYDKTVLIEEFYPISEKVYFHKPTKIIFNGTISGILNPALWGQNAWASAAQNSNYTNMVSGSYALSSLSVRPVIGIYNEAGKLHTTYTLEGRHTGECRGEFKTTTHPVDGFSPEGTIGTETYIDQLLINGAGSSLRYLNYSYSNLSGTVSGSGYAAFGLVIENKVALKFGFSSSTFYDIPLTSPYVSYNVSSGSTVSYEASGYASKYFANGLVLGTKPTNGVQLYNKDNNMNIEFASNSRALRLNSGSLGFNPQISSVYCPLVFLIGYGENTTINLPNGNYWSGTSTSTKAPYVTTFLFSNTDILTLFGLSSVSEILVHITPKGSTPGNVSYSWSTSGTSAGLTIYSSVANISIALYGMTNA